MENSKDNGKQQRQWKTAKTMENSKDNGKQQRQQKQQKAQVSNKDDKNARGAQIQSIILYSTAKTLKNNGYLMQKKMQFFY